MGDALIQDGTFSGPTNLSVQNGKVRRRVTVDQVNTSGDGQVFAGDYGRWYRQADAVCLWEVSSAFPSPLGGTASGGIFACIQAASLAKSIVVKNDSCASTAQGTIAVSQGIKRYSGTVRGFLADDETGILAGNPALTALTLPLDATHSVAANAILQFEEYEYNFAEAGKVPGRFAFVLTGAVTLNGGATNPFAADTWSASLVADNGETHAGTVAIQTLAAQIDYRTARKPRFRVSGPFDGAYSIT